MAKNIIYIFSMNKALTAAVQTVEKLVRECYTGNTTRLPTTFEMAKAAGVSVPTMTKALRVLSRKGIIKTAPKKKGITINLEFTSLPSYQKNRSSLPKWQYLIRRIEEEIIPHLTNASSLIPSLKELSNRFGVSHKTLQKSLIQLEKIGRLQKFKKGYRVHPQFSVSGKRKIIAVLQDTFATDFLRVRPIYYDLLHILEMICAHNNLLLDFLLYTEDGAVDNHSFKSICSRPDEILGFIVIAGADEHFPVFHLLHPTAKPVSVLDAETPDVRFPFLGSSRFKVFQLAMSADAGSKTAYFLKDRGHKHIAYLSIWHEWEWSQIRLEGILNVYDRLGPDFSVTPVCISIRNYYKDHKYYNRLVVKQNQYDPFRVGYISNRLALKQPIEEICRKALENKEITAWIAANDYIALNCIDYLKKRKIAVPGDISIIGFDDIFESINYQLTTYNFNSYALIHSMYNFLSDSQHSGSPTKQTAMEVCDGYIVERKTVAQKTGMQVT
jgi:DNA-binding LacI/PurR family transcriptional regulator